MGSALGLGIVKSNILSNNSSMTVCDYYDNFSPFVNQFNQIIQSQSQSQSNKTISLKTTLNNIEGIKNADIVFLAVKPDVIPLILKQLAPHWKGTYLIIYQYKKNNKNKLKNKLKCIPHKTDPCALSLHENTFFNTRSTEIFYCFYLVFAMFAAILAGYHVHFYLDYKGVLLILFASGIARILVLLVFIRYIFIIFCQQYQKNSLIQYLMLFIFEDK